MADQNFNFGDGAPASAGSDADGTYVTQAELVTAFGEDLLAKWTSRDATSSAIDTDVLAQALRDAEGEVEDFFRGGLYALPFVFTDARSRQVLKRWVMALTGEKLMLPRSLQPGQRASPGTPTEREKLTSEADRVRRQMLNYIHGGGPRFNANHANTIATNAPAIV